MVRYWRPLSIGRSGSWWVRSFVSSSPGLGQLSPQIPTRKVLPLTVPATAIVRQVLGLVSGDRSKATHHVRGFLNTGTFGRAPFDSTGEIELPKLASSSS